MSALPHFFTRTLCGTCVLLLLLQGTALAEGSEPGFEEKRSARAVNVEPGFQGKTSTRTALAGSQDAWKAITRSQNVLDLSDEKVRAKAKEMHGVSLDADEHIAIEGTFTRDAARKAKDGEALAELMVIDLKDNTISFHKPGHRTVRLSDLSFPSKKELQALGATQVATAVEIVPDGTLQVLVWRKDEVAGAGKKKGKPAYAYKATVYKVIGNHIGAPLDREVARSTSATSTPVVTATLEPTQQEQFTRFVYTPLRTDGTPDKSNQLQLRWNQWEGVFRHPRPVPTAPKRDKTRS
ncbi:MAG: hypothetical protein VYE40_15055 [Myxococcota bacterium]|nr:hypothetical protein [Myxococcota bacterium]